MDLKHVYFSNIPNLHFIHNVSKSKTFPLLYFCIHLGYKENSEDSSIIRSLLFLLYRSK
jgi:hypothetical protein